MEQRMRKIEMEIDDKAIAEKLAKYHDDLVDSAVRDYFRDSRVQREMREEIKKRIQLRVDMATHAALEKIDIAAKVEEAIDAIIAKRAETLFKARMKAAE